MKNLIAILITMAVGSTAFADDAPEKPAPPKPAQSGWNKKFVLQSEDGRFRLNVGGRLQAYYEAWVPDDQVNRVQFGSSFSSKPVTSDTSQFRIRRGRVALDGNLYDPKLQYEVQVELAGSAVTLKRAYLNWKRSEGLQFRAGRLKAPYGRQQLASIFKQQFTDRTVVSNEYTKGDDDGVMVWGMPAKGRFEYYLGVFNGDGQNRNSQQDNRNQWFGRAVWSPKGKFAYSESSLGASKKPQFSFGANASRNGGWLFEVNGKPGIQGPTETCTASGCLSDQGDNASISGMGVDAALNWDRFSTVGEVFTRRIDPRQPGVRNIDSRGWYAQAGYFVVRDKWETGVRFGVLDLNSDLTNDRSVERGIFLSRYLRGHDYKFQSDFTDTRTEGIDAGGRPAALNDRRLRVQLVVSF